MKNVNIFCFGFGQVAKNFLYKVKSEDYRIKLSTTSTDKTSKKNIYGIDYKSYFFKDQSYDKDIIRSLKEADYILISIPPINGEDIVKKNFSKIIEKYKPIWITYLSATSVYGDHKGQWVDEKSLTKPTSSSGVERLIAEKTWLSFGLEKNLPIQIFRLSGIYSSKMNILARLRSGNVNLVKTQNHFFSRIHVEDIANVLFKSLSNFKTGEIYNISDDKPASMEEVTLYGVKLLNVDIPKIIEVKDIDSEMLKSFYKDSKKVSNKKMKSFFDYKLKFPTYVEGLNYIRNNLV